MEQASKPLLAFFVIVFIFFFFSMSTFTSQVDRASRWLRGNHRTVQREARTQCDLPQQTRLLYWGRWGRRQGKVDKRTSCCGNTAEASRSFHWFRRSLESTLSMDKVQREKVTLRAQEKHSPTGVRDVGLWVWLCSLCSITLFQERHKQERGWGQRGAAPPGSILDNQLQSVSLQWGSRVRWKLKNSQQTGTRHVLLSTWMVVMPLGFSFQTDIWKLCAFCALPSRAVSSLS